MTWAAAIPILGSLLDKVLPDAEAKAKAQLELAKLQQDGAFRELDAALQTAAAQSRINEIEAAQSSAFASGWRPAAGWVCVLGLCYEFLLRPLLPWLLQVSGAAEVPELPALDGVLTELLFGMLGLGAMRSLERHGRVRSMAGK